MKTRKQLSVGVICLILSVGFVVQGKPDEAAGVRLRSLSLPLHFERNDGQTGPAVKFLSRGKGYALFLTPNEAVLRLMIPSDRRPDSVPAQNAVLRMRLLDGNNAARMTGLAELPGKVNYFRGNDPAKWRANVPTYGQVKYEQVYPGIDLVFYGNSQQELEYDFVVAPGADPNQIKLGFTGADNIETADNGDLVLQISDRQILQRKPRVYQLVNGREREISGSYRLRRGAGPDATGETIVAFNLSEHDKSIPLVIDPVLSFSTFLGGTGFDAGTAVAVDSVGDVYVAGRTDAGFPGLNPVSPEPPHTVNGDAFVVKLKGDGSGFVYAVYLGGSSGAQASGIAVDSAGNACIMGDTWSGDFPLVNPIQPNHKYGGPDAFVAKLNPSGNAILYSTFLGGSGSDGGRRITVDASDNAYVTGITTSDDFPTTAGAFQTNLSGGWDAFATKINSEGSAIVYSTYLGGSGDEFSYNSPTIAVDSSGNAYVVGTTGSTNFPTTAGAFQTQYGGGSSDAFVTKFNPAGTALVYSTYLGGSSYDSGIVQDARVDQQGSAYVAGDSGSPDFPLTPGPFSTSPNYPALFTMSGELFLSKLSSDGSSLVYSTRLPGQHCYGIAVDSAGSAWVTGDTGSQNGNVVFPLVNPIQSAFGGGGSDAFILKVTPDGDQLQFSSYYGGSDNENSLDIATDGQGNAYVVGQTASASFPTTNAVQVAFGGVADAFVLKISDPDVTPPVILAAGNYGELNIVTIDFSEALDVASATNAANYGMDHGVAVNSVNIGVNSRSVRLLTSGLVFGTNYTLTVNGVLDRAPSPNPIVPDTQVNFTGLGLYRGFLRQEIYDGVGTGNLADLTNSAKFPGHPDSVTDIHQAEIVSGAYYQDGVRLTGWLLPPVTGEYTLYLCNASQAALYLSRNESPLNKVRIAFEPCGFGCGGSGPRSWNHPVPGWNGTPLPNVSLPILLEAGKAYYLEALASSSATDVLGLAWRPPGEPVPDNSDLPISGSYLAVQGNPQSAALNITLEPQSVSVAEWETASFMVKAAASPPNIYYQWRKDGADLPGENEPSFVISETPLSYSGNSYDCVLTVPGASQTSQAALLTVTNDVTPPTLLSAEGNITSGHVTLTFSEPINAGDATNTAYYLLSGGLTVSNAVLLADRRTVVLTTSPQTPGSNYTVQVSVIRDRSTAGNSAVVGTQAPFFGWVDEEFVGPFASWANVKQVYGAVGDGVADDTAALQQALNEVATPGHAAVLYFPTGTYRITQTLHFFGRRSASLVGEDPVTTIIKWDGPVDGDLMFADGVVASRWTRLTWDGSGKARFAVHHGYTGGWQVTANLHTDEIFKDLAGGLLVDPVNGGDSHTIIRCHFLRCSAEGIATSSYNAIDWHIWDSVFEDCRYGLISYVGNFHVYRSLFLRSTEMDIFCGTGYTGIRGNTSIGSKSFTDHYINYQVTIQGNTIIDSLDPTPIHWPAGGSMILLDNTIASRADVTNGPVVQIGDNLTSVGNTFTVPNPIAVGGRAITMEDRVVSRDSVGLAPVMIPRFLPKSTSPVVEVPVGANAATIQQAIDAAATMNGLRPIVHLPAGDYYLDRTLVIPANCDLQLVGDGYIGSATTLHGNSAINGAALQLVGPSRATLRDFHLVGVSKGTGIAVENCDQPQARVFMEHVWASGGGVNNLLVDRLDNTDVSLQDLTHGDADQVSLRVIGGARQSAGQLTSGRVDQFGGGAGGGNLSYQVEHGGRLMVQDSWFEGPEPGFMRLTDSGTFTLNNALIAAGDPNHGGAGEGLAEIGDFHGPVSLLNTTFIHTRAVVSGNGSATDVLFLGCTGLDVVGATNGQTYLDNQSPNAQVEQLMSASSGLQIPNVGIGGPVFLRQMLSQLRTETPRRLVPLPAGVTDVRMYGVGVEACRVGIRLTGTNAPPQLVPIPTEFVVAEGSTLTVTNQATDADLPFDAFTFTLGPGAPSGISLNPTNGVLTWTPIESDGPSVNTFQIIVGDDGSPRLFVTNTLTITVLESNLPPTLGVVGVVTNTVLDGLVNVTAAPPHPARLLPSLDFLGNGDFNLFAGGNQFQGFDDGAFAYQRISGDFDVSVRLAGMEALRPETSAGLMVRETFDDFSRQLHVLAHPAGITQDGRVGSGSFATYQRSVTGGPADRWDSGYGGGTVSLPHAWMRLQRQDQSFRAYWSDDGLNWNQIGQHTATPPYPRELYIGFAVSSGHTEINAHFEFRSYQNLVSTLVPMPDATASEGQLLTFNVNANDPDVPLQDLTFTLDSGAPDGASIDPDTGLFQWTPNKQQGGGTFPITVRVTDNGDPALSTTNSFTVTVNEVNTAPVLTLPPNTNINEVVLFTANATATDADLPANSLTFAPVSGPDGLTVSTNGVIDWTPTEVQGPNTYTVLISVTDTNPLAVNEKSLSVTNSFKIVVNEVNLAPVLALPPDQTINELDFYTNNATATDADLPANALHFALVSGPSNLTVYADGGISWTPAEEQGPSTNVITVRVTDDSPFAVNAQHLSMTNSFQIIVNEVNVAPVLTLPPNTSINEMVAFTATATATDPDIPTNALTFALISGPSNLTVSASGVINWTPDESQGPSNTTVTISVTDTNPIALDAKSLSVTSSFQIIVSEVNVAPELGALSNYTVNAGQTISFTAMATDTDVPTNTLSFSLLNPPAGANINGASGLFTWRPGVTLANTTNTIQVRVQDNGLPVLAATQAFNVIVNPLAPVVLTAINFTNGVFRLQVEGIEGPDYVLMAATNQSGWTDLTTNTPSEVPFQFTDPQAGSFPTRSYRVRLQP